MIIYSEAIIEKMEQRIRREQRILRIFKKYGPVLKAHNISMSTDEDGTVSLSCTSTEKANWAASLLGLNQPKYFYVRHQAPKEAVIQDGDVEFHFYANDVREIHLGACCVKRQRAPAGRSRRAWLYFNDWEIAQTQFMPGFTTHIELKKKLWALAHEKFERDLRYRLVD